MLHSMSLAGLQMVTACHPPCPGELLNKLFVAGSSSLHKEKCQKRVTPGGGGEIWHLSHLLLAFFLPFFYRPSLCLHLAAKRRGLEEIAHAFPSEVGLFLLYSVLAEA